MNPVIPYLTFPGTCREAMNFYADALEGEVTVMTTMGESPIPVPPEAQAAIFNSEVRSGDLVLKASDNPEHDGATSSISLYLHFDDTAQRQVTFDRFASQGTVLFPIDGPFAMVEDRFGTRWMLTTDG